MKKRDPDPPPPPPDDKGDGGPTSEWDDLLGTVMKGLDLPTPPAEPIITPGPDEKVEVGVTRGWEKDDVRISGIRPVPGEESGGRQEVMISGLHEMPPEEPTAAPAPNEEVAAELTSEGSGKAVMMSSFIDKDGNPWVPPGMSGEVEGNSSNRTAMLHASDVSAAAELPAWTGEDVTMGGNRPAMEAPAEGVPAWTGEDVTMGGNRPAMEAPAEGVPAWTGEDVTMGGNRPAMEAPAAGAAPWTGEDATMGGGGRQAMEAPAKGAVPWTGEDATMGGKRDASEAPAVSEGVPAWTGEDATMGGRGAPVAAAEAAAAEAIWTGDGVTESGRGAPAPAAVEAAAAEAIWTGDGVTEAGRGVPAAAVGTGAGAPSTAASPRTPLGVTGTGTGTAQGTATSGRTKARTDSFLNMAARPDRETVIQNLQAKDDGWLMKGRAAVLTGQTLGDFLVGGVLGEGGMGVVYRGRQISLDRRVAIKVLPAALNDDPILSERFAIEAHTAGMVVSPYVVQVHFAGSENDHLFYAMEFVEGTDLHHLLGEYRQRKEMIPPEQAARWVVQAARGLAAAAEHKIVHRDIKPQNLLLTTDLTVKIADFGIAKIIGDQGLTMAGSTVGTPAYSSPEQGRGDPVDGRSDLYSLGVIFYELLTLRKPFEGSKADALIYQHNYAEPPPILKLRPDLPPVYESACMRLLMKDPGQRYQKATDLADDLERIIGGMNVTIPAYVTKFGTGAEAALRKHMGWRRRMIPIAAAVLAVALVGSWYGWSSLQANEVARRRAALKPLDHVATVPRSAVADLAWLKQRLGAKDADVQRWQRKLTLIETLRARLSRLDAGTDLLAAKLRAEAETDLAAWSAAVGDADPDGRRWAERVAATRAEEVRLKAELAPMDQLPVVSVAEAERLRPLLAALTRLVLPGDADRTRWQGRLDEQVKELERTAKSLPTLDGEADITEPKLIALHSDWRLFRAMVGEGDARVAAWGASLSRREEALAALRANCTRLDRVDLASTVLQADLVNDLARMKALAAPDDAQLAGWLAKIEASNLRIADLRQRLAQALDQPGDLAVDLLSQCATWLGEYRSLVSPDDGRLLAWDRRLPAEHQAVEALKRTLSRLDQETPLTLAEQAACHKAFDGLVARAALGPEVKARIVRRLIDEADHVAALRAALARHRQEKSGVSDSLRTALADLAAVTGSEDSDVLAWQSVVAEHDRRRAQLAALDRVESLPDDAEASCARLAELAPPDDPQVARWTAKLTRVAELTDQLQPLTRGEPPPVNAAEMLTELADRWVGQDDPQVRTGRARLHRITELRQALMPLGSAWVIPAELPVERYLQELMTLVGPNDPQVSAWVRRARILNGPPKPTWAAAAGHDRFGPWVEAPVMGIRLRLRLVPGGTSLVGSGTSEPGRRAEEAISHAVTVTSFWLAETEVSQALAAALFQEGNCTYTGARLPLESVSWDDALRLLAALGTVVPGMEPRLPTADEWEYACRAGNLAPWSGPDGEQPENRLDQVAWFAGRAGTHPVGYLLPNRLGLYDMHGNVWEWVEASDLRAANRRLLCGGSWADPADRLRAAARAQAEPELRSRLVGMRIAAPARWPAGDNPEAPMPVAGVKPAK